MIRTAIPRCLLARTLPLALVVLGITAGFQSARATDDYSYLQSRPIPKNDAELRSECNWIKTEEARIQSQADQGLATAAKYNSAGMADSIKTTAIRDLGHLDDRYAQLQCGLIGTNAIRPAIPRSPQLLAPYQIAAAAPQPAAAPTPQPAPLPAPSVVPPAAPASTPALAAVPPTQTGALTAQPANAPVQAASPATSCGGLTFDQCFAKCRELTKRTAEQCFDACRH